MALTYTDSDKIVLEAWGKFEVILSEACEPGDLLNLQGNSATYSARLADDSDDRPAHCIAITGGAIGDKIWACLKAVCSTIPTISTGGVVTAVYFAASTDYFGSDLYLGEAGKPESTVGSTCQQVVGCLLERDKILLDVLGKGSLIDIRNATWGTVITQGHHIYFNNDYTCYIGSSVANVLIIGTTAGKVEFRCGAHGAAITIDNDGLYTAYLIRVTGIIDFGASDSGAIKLPRRSGAIPAQAEGTMWYNPDTDKMQFRTAAGNETVTSA